MHDMVPMREITPPPLFNFEESLQKSEAAKPVVEPKKCKAKYRKQVRRRGHVEAKRKYEQKKAAAKQVQAQVPPPPAKTSSCEVTPYHVKSKVVRPAPRASRPNPKLTPGAAPEGIRLWVERQRAELGAMHQAPMYPPLDKAFKAAQLKAYEAISNVRNVRFRKYEENVAFMHYLNDGFNEQYRTMLFMALLLFNPRLRRARRKRAHMLHLLRYVLIVHPRSAAM